MFVLLNRKQFEGIRTIEKKISSPILLNRKRNTILVYLHISVGIVNRIIEAFCNLFYTFFCNLRAN